MACFQIAPNIVGLDEYLRWYEKANVEPMFTINLGTGNIKEAMHLAEYYRYMVDYISVHYYHKAPEGDIKNYLKASSVIEEHPKTIISNCDYVQAKIGAPKKVYISGDEYGFAFGKQQEITFGCRGWKDASKVFMQFRPREHIFVKNDSEKFVHFKHTSFPILETLGNNSILLALLRYVDRVKIACMTGELGKAIAFDGRYVWKNALYYSYYQLNKFAKNGTSLLPVVEDPTFNTVQCSFNDFNHCHSYKNVGSIEAATVYREDNKKTDIFMINRDIERDKAKICK